MSSQTKTQKHWQKKITQALWLSKAKKQALLNAFPKLKIKDFKKLETLFAQQEEKFLKMFSSLIPKKKEKFQKGAFEVSKKTKREFLTTLEKQIGEKEDLEVLLRNL